MTLEPFEIRDPEQLITDVAEQVDLGEDTAHVVLVRAPSTTQEVIEVRTLDLPALLDDDDNISDDLCDLARSFAVPDVRPPQHAVVTVIVRPGRCIFGPNEGVWLAGWRYSNHLAPIYDSDLILVTEHGWTDLMTTWSGRHPAMLDPEPSQTH